MLKSETFANLYEYVMLAVLGFAPLIVLAWKNWRAVPIGLCVFLSVFTLTFGLYIILTSPFPERLVQLVAVALLAVLTFFSFRFAGDNLGSRLTWTALSLVAWIMASMFGMHLVDTIQQNARFARGRVERAAEEADIARKRADLEANPAKRRAVLDAQLSRQVNGWHPFLGQARYVTFGDPARDVEHVTVWAIVTLNEHQQLALFNHDLKKIFSDLKFYLPREGYAWPVGVGAVEERDVAAAGGDAKFFGVDGRNVIPQWPATTTAAELNQPTVPPLEPPARNIAGR